MSHPPVSDDVLGEDSVGLHHQIVRGELHHRGLQKSDDEVHRANLGLNVLVISIVRLPSQKIQINPLHTWVSNG